MFDLVLVCHIVLCTLGKITPVIHVFLFFIPYNSYDIAFLLEIMFLLFFIHCSSIPRGSIWIQI